jgi:hypothetical protein
VADQWKVYEREATVGRMVADFARKEDAINFLGIE